MHAYFYRPNVAVDALKHHKHIILQSFDEKFRDLLIDGGLEVQRYGLPQVEGPPELVRGDAVVTPEQLTRWKSTGYTAGGTWRNGSTFTLIEFYNKYHNHEEYFLHAPDGSRLYSSSGNRRFYLLRPKFAAKQWWTDVIAIMDRDKWTGPAFVDNVGLDADKIREVLSELNLKGPIQEYAGGDVNALYQAEWAEFLAVGKAMLGKRRLFVNGIGDWRAQRDITPIANQVHGMMLEAFAPWLVMRSSWTVDDDLRMLKRVQWLAEQGKEVICVCHLSGKDTPERRSYEYARYLMVANDLTSVRLVIDGDYKPITTVPEMDLVLGNALSAYKVGGKIVSRLFEHYFVSIDLEKKTYSFVKQEPTPDEPIDPLAELKSQVAAMIADLQRTIEQQGRTIAGLEQHIVAQEQTVAELQQRLSQPISFSGTVKI